MADLKSTPGISTRLDGALGLSRRCLVWRKPHPDGGAAIRAHKPALIWSTLGKCFGVGKFWRA